MTAALARFLPSFSLMARPVATQAPGKGRAREPVFIHDAIVPWQGETLLLAMLRKDLEDGDQP
ncbi:hypothetical protein [Chachezhania antarctica]|uniref:hypothetical protein n=1 Tax=Chachezhania antarctica TaxID=2340860 RepID=UPI000EB514BC|nr:hypothetical protein [Chachezhania antarctica]|tara:strand:+ start:22 stop:210 length:189 start_codon:yes stop_codon:yes gene_type:complete